MYNTLYQSDILKIAPETAKRLEKVLQTFLALRLRSG